MKNKDEVWYCENSKGQKIAPYHQPKPEVKNNRFDTLLNTVGVIIGITLLTIMIYTIITQL